MHRAALFLPATLALVAACSDAGDAGGAPPDTDMAAPDRVVALAPEPVYRVGGFDAPAWAEFGEVDDLVFDGRGFLYILDGQTDVISKVAPDGSFVGTVGRPGEGPGEVRSPTGLIGLPEGGVAVVDFGHRAHVVYDSAGTWVGNVRLDVEGVGMPRDAAPHPDGGAVGRVGIRVRTGDADESDEATSTRPVAWFPLSAGDTSRVLYRAYELPELDPGEMEELGTSTGTSIRLQMTAERAWEPALRVAVLPDGRIAVSDSTAWRIKLVDLEGAVVGTLERPIAPTPVTPAVQEAERARRLAEYDSAQGGGGSRITVLGSGSDFAIDPGAMRDMLRARTENMVFADEIPVIEDLAVDGFGRVWVQRSSPEPGQDGPTDLVTADGRYLGSLAPDGLRIPEAFGPDGLMARVETDDVDVPTVVVERLDPEIR